MQIPHLHNLRLWSAIACACTIAFVAIVLGISIHDGRHWDEYVANDPELGPGTPRSYAVLGSTASKSFDAMGALATIAFACESLSFYTQNSIVTVTPLLKVAKVVPFIPA